MRAIDEGGSEEEWSTISSFTVDLDLPESTILYPQDGADLSKVNLIRGESTDNDGIDFTRISIYDITAKKYFNGTGFTVDLETWLTTTPAGGWRPKVNWHYIAPTWSEGHSYTIRSRATDTAGNEEHTDAITFTYDTVNWEEGSIYVSNPAVMTNSNYKIYYPNTLTVPEDSYLEVDFDDTFAFSPWLENSDVTLTDVGGGISASVATFDRENKIIRSTINTGSVWVNDLIELSVNNLKIHNPSATGSYVLPIVIYDSVGAEIEAGTGMITLDYPYQQVQLNVNIEESLQLGVDSGSVLIEVDPDDQLGQNWSGTGGEVSEKTAVEVKTNAQSGYNLMISLSGKTATGSAVLDGRTLTGSQITSTAGDRVDLENNFTFVLNSSGSTSVTDFKNTTTQIIWAGTSGATNGYIDNIFYYLNVDHTIPADSYEGTIVYTAIRQL